MIPKWFRITKPAPARAGRRGAVRKVVDRQTVVPQRPRPPPVTMPNLSLQSEIDCQQFTRGPSRPDCGKCATGPKKLTRGIDSINNAFAPRGAFTRGATAPGAFDACDYSVMNPLDQEGLMANRSIMLSEKDMVQSWYNVVADLPKPAGTAARCRHRPAGRLPIPCADLPEALIEQEISTQRWIDIPNPVQRSAEALAADPAGPRLQPGTGAGHPGADLLQERKRQPGRQPQAQHRGGPGLLQQGSRDHAASPPRPGPASGAAPWLSPATSSAWSARSTWCGSASSRSLSART